MKKYLIAILLSVSVSGCASNYIDDYYERGEKCTSMAYAKRVPYFQTDENINASDIDYFFWLGYDIGHVHGCMRALK